MRSLRAVSANRVLAVVLGGALLIAPTVRADSAPEATVEATAAPKKTGLFDWIWGSILRGEPAVGADVGAAMGVGEIWGELDPGVGVRIHAETDLPLVSFLRLEAGAGFERMSRTAESADGAFSRIPLYASAMLRAPYTAGGWLRPYVRGGLGGSSAQLSGVRGQSNFDPLLHAGGGVLFPMGRAFGDSTVEARLDVTYNAQFQSRTGNFMLVSLGLTKTLIFDADGDGINDDLDDCVQSPEDRDGFRDDDGCPDDDNDADQVLDADDGCPTIAEDRDGFLDEDGCIDPDNDVDGIEDTRDGCIDDAEDKDDFEDDDGCPDKDNDKDTLLDKADACPNEAEDADGYQDGDGCPDGDNDNDGIGDAADACPLQPEDKNGFKDDDGCPDAKDDKDKDGIADKLDKCPTDAEDVDAFQDDDGCPEPDNDNDGLLDKVDACPVEPEDKDGVADEDGCFEDDYDADGIGDQGDKCPLEAEVINGVEDGDGCPDEGATLVELKAERIEIKEKVFFKTGSHEIDDRSFGLLQQLGALMLNHQELARVRIEGHTDDVGADDFNQSLSQRRSESVRDFLGRWGIDPARLVAVGYGEAKPIAPNTSRIGRELNRRVEFIVEEQAPKAKSQVVAPAPVAPPPSAPPAAAAPVADAAFALHALAKAQSLEDVSKAFWASAVHAELLLQHNPQVSSITASLPAGTVVKIPRTIDYVVMKGDGLGDIAKKLLGKINLYKAIAEASKAVLPDPNKMEVGMTLTIPLVHPDVEKKLSQPK